jgi:hypothetical protein
MKAETFKMLENVINKQNKDLDKICEYIGITAIFPEDYTEFLNMYNGGNGSIGENSYLQLWSFEDIAELNEDYAVGEFLTSIVLIGSDGGDTAYGINKNRKYIEVPFIGMDDDEVQEIASDFDEFIEFLYNK